MALITHKLTLSLGLVLVALVYLCSAAPSSSSGVKNFNPLAVVGQFVQSTPTNTGNELVELNGRTPPGPPGGPGGLPSTSPLGLLHRIATRLIANVLKVVRRILHRVQIWVLQTSDYLELMQARRFFGPALNQILDRLVGWMRQFAGEESACIGRVLCELSDQAGNYMPAAMKQMLLIYFSTNQDQNLYYQPLANGFVSRASCPLLYGKCNQNAFLAHLESFNATVVSELENSIDQLQQQQELATNTIGGVPPVVSTFAVRQEVEPQVATPVVVDTTVPVQSQNPVQVVEQSLAPAAPVAALVMAPPAPEVSYQPPALQPQTPETGAEPLVNQA